MHSNSGACLTDYNGCPSPRLTALFLNTSLLTFSRLLSFDPCIRGDELTSRRYCADENNMTREFSHTSEHQPLIPGAVLSTLQVIADVNVSVADSPFALGNNSKIES